MMQRISKEELVQRLETVLDYPVGERGLRILLYGWRKYRHYGDKYCHALEVREWLYCVEVADLSEYAQYDLTKTQRNEFCKTE